MGYLKCFVPLFLPVFSPCAVRNPSTLAHLVFLGRQELFPSNIKPLVEAATQGGTGGLFFSPFVSPRSEQLCHLIILSGITCHYKSQHYFSLVVHQSCLQLPSGAALPITMNSQDSLGTWQFQSERQNLLYNEQTRCQTLSHGMLWRLKAYMG